MKVNNVESSVNKKKSPVVKIDKNTLFEREVVFFKFCNYKFQRAEFNSTKKCSLHPEETITKVEKSPVQYC